MNLSNQTVEQLRKSGHKVQIHHFRVHNGMENPADMLKKAGVMPSPKGGKTEVKVKLPDGKEVFGVAKCSLVDCFNKKLGVRIALGRLEEHNEKS